MFTTRQVARKKLFPQTETVHGITDLLNMIINSRAWVVSTRSLTGKPSNKIKRYHPPIGLCNW